MTSYSDTKQRKLSVKWDKKEKDLMIDFPNGSDGNMVYDYFFKDKTRACFLGDEVIRIEFDPSFKDELKIRGYDITTLKFSKELKEQEK